MPELCAQIKRVCIRNSAKSADYKKSNKNSESQGVTSFASYIQEKADAQGLVDPKPYFIQDLPLQRRC
jgi:hypothetical protein